MALMGDDSARASLGGIAHVEALLKITVVDVRKEVSVEMPAALVVLRTITGKAESEVCPQLRSSRRSETLFGPSIQPAATFVLHRATKAQRGALKYVGDIKRTIVQITRRVLTGLLSSDRCVLPGRAPRV